MVTTKYFKRYRMEIDLRYHVPAPPSLPDGYCFQAWGPEHLEHHADVKFRSFRWELDAEVFPCLGEYDGCLQLMREIAQRDGFLPETTWLIGHISPDRPQTIDYCGTIQGIRCDRYVGGIQNVGTTPPHRGIGIGAALVAQSLYGFYTAGCHRVFLEVTAENAVAVRLYRRLGFRHARTVYKSAEIAYT